MHQLLGVDAVQRDKNGAADTKHSTGNREINLTLGANNETKDDNAQSHNDREGGGCMQEDEARSQ